MLNSLDKLFGGQELEPSFFESLIHTKAKKLLTLHISLSQGGNGHSNVLYALAL
jgi:hypothetical protein